MYNGIGLRTARGSGTSGYVQSNKAYVKPASTRREEKELKRNGANAEILEHCRKREIEVKVFELRDALEEKGLEPAVIDERCDKLRASLLHSKVQSRPAIETHAAARAKEEQDLKLRDAFGLSRDHVEGAAFDRELQKQLKLERDAKREERRRAEAAEREERRRRKRAALAQRQEPRRTEAELGTLEEGEELCPKRQRIFEAALPPPRDEEVVDEQKQQGPEPATRSSPRQEAAVPENKNPSNDSRSDHLVHLKEPSLRAPPPSRPPPRRRAKRSASLSSQSSYSSSGSSSSSSSSSGSSRSSSSPSSSSRSSRSSSSSRSSRSRSGSSRSSSSSSSSSGSSSSSSRSSSRPRGRGGWRERGRRPARHSPPPRR